MQNNGQPRKVIVGTSMFATWGDYPGLEKRLENLGQLVDEMADEARRQYSRSIDIAALPEMTVCGGLPLGPEGAFPLEGRVQDYFAAKAREHHCYITVPMLMTDAGQSEVYNVAALVGRRGELVGIYRKVHVVVSRDSDLPQCLCQPGREFPVFECDFGRIGIQICWDMAYDDGWRSLARKGAELVIWTTQSPGQIKAQIRARLNNYYVLTSTWRNNASLIDPTGHVIRSISGPDQRVLVEEIDLEYALVPWQPKLNNGLVLRDTYGDGVGFRYSEAEDGGIFWSNDPAISIMQMVRELGLELEGEQVERGRALQDAARGGPPRVD